MGGGVGLGSLREGGRTRTSILHLPCYSSQGHGGLLLIPADMAAWGRPVAGLVTVSSQGWHVEANKRARWQLTPTVTGDSVTN